jgi:hypothetical protein
VTSPSLRLIPIQPQIDWKLARRLATRVMGQRSSNRRLRIRRKHPGECSVLNESVSHYEVLFCPVPGWTRCEPVFRNWPVIKSFGLTYKLDSERTHL